MEKKMQALSKKFKNQSLDYELTKKEMDIRDSAAKRIAEAIQEAERKMIAVENAWERKLNEEVKAAEKLGAENVRKQLEAERGKIKPIRFKDALGRKFSFPFHLCASWAVGFLGYCRHTSANISLEYGNAYKASV
jgi:hypothetical protein